MKMEIIGPYTHVPATDVEAFAVSYLTADDGESGIVENADRKAEKVCKAFGRLLDVLAAKGILSAMEIGGIVVGESFASPPDPCTARFVLGKE